MLKLTVRELNEEEKEKSQPKNMPCIAVVIVDERNNTELDTRYIYPMRGYCFQIGGLNANGESASSEVIGLGNIIRAFKDYKFPEKNRNSIYTSSSTIFIDQKFNTSIVGELLNGQAMLAIVKYFNKWSDPEDLKLLLESDETKTGPLEESISLTLDPVIGNANLLYTRNIGYKRNVWGNFIEECINKLIQWSSES